MDTNGHECHPWLIPFRWEMGESGKQKVPFGTWEPGAVHGFAKVLYLQGFGEETGAKIGQKWYNHEWTRIYTNQGRQRSEVGGQRSEVRRTSIFELPTAEMLVIQFYYE